MVCLRQIYWARARGDAKPKTTREPQDSPNDHQALSILDHTINKPAINLDLVEIQCLQLCKRRIPGPEIVEGDSNSRLPQFVDHSLRHVDIFYKRALGATLIPNVVYTIIWAGRLQRHRAIWEEHQFRLQLTDHPNAISVLFRVLFELSIENYIERTNLSSVHPNDKLARKALQVAEDLHSKKRIDQKYLGGLPKASAARSAGLDGYIEPLCALTQLCPLARASDGALGYALTIYCSLSQRVACCLRPEIGRAHV